MPGLPGTVPDCTTPTEGPVAFSLPYDQVVSTSLELRIGLAGFRKLERAKGDWAGAYTNVVTWAADQQDFREKVHELAASLNMFVMEIEDVEPVGERFAVTAPSEEIDDLIARAEANPDALLFGTFHTYPADEG